MCACSCTVIVFYWLKLIVPQSLALCTLGFGLWGIEGLGDKGFGEFGDWGIEGLGNWRIGGS